MKKIFLFIVSTILIFTINSTLATERNENDTTYLYTNESGELIESGEYEYDDNSILIEDEEDYNDLYDGENAGKETQEELKTSFEEQSSELAILEKYDESNNQKMIITEILSDIKTEYTTDYYYYYVLKYQIVKIRDVDGYETSAVVIHSYDVADNKNLKPLKVGDTVYGYMEIVTLEDETYNMVNHGLEDSEIAYVSINTQDRTLGIVLLAIFSILLLALYTGKHGMKLLIPIAVAIDLLFIVLIPELLIGKNIIILASLIALELIVLISVLKNGWSRKTVIAIISSIIVVILVASLGAIFANSNSLTGKGIMTEENYDLLTNVYYIDKTFKTTVNMQDICLAIIILVSSVLSASISSKLTELSEKYAGTKDMVNNIIEEAKPMVSEYPMIISIIFFTSVIPDFMIMICDSLPFSQMINSESVVTNISIWLISIISSLIIAPITAIISNLLMGEVEIKQLENKNN